MTPSRLPLLQGLPDDGKARCELDASGNLCFGLPTSAMYMQGFAPEIASRMPPVHVQAGKRVHLPQGMPGNPVVNYTADGDRCSRSLRQMAEMVHELGCPTFNHPDAVLRASRDGVARALADLPGLHVPRTERLAANTATELLARIGDAGLRYPLLLRCPGMHVGNTMTRVEGPGEIDAAIFHMPIQGRGVYATEFVDYRDGDGLYRKMRLVVVGERVFIRHFVIADRWMVHVENRIRIDHPEEEAMLQGFPGSLPMDVVALARQVADRLGLDYFGIDCSPRPDGRLLLFEANPAMDILRRQQSPQFQARWDARIDAIQDALVALLFDPARWRDAPRAPAA